MIQANELRIGNWIQDEYGKYWQVQELCQLKGDELTLNNSVGATYRSMSGIPLTPEILEKCGFEYDKHTYSLGSFWLSEGEHGNWVVWLHGLSNGVTTTVQYVHELQNLFYCIKSSELEIKL